MRISIPILAILVLSACSARVFETETRAFQQGVTATEEAWILAWDKLDALEQAKRDRQRVREGWAFDKTPECDRLVLHSAALPVDETARKNAIKSRKDALVACRLIQNRSDGNVVPIEADPIANRKLLPEAQAITAYANGLAALTAAPDEAAFRTAAADMAASLTKAGEKLTAAGGSDFEVSGPISALTGVFGELALAGIEARKFRTLRRIVQSTDPSIQKVAGQMAPLESQFRQRLLFEQSRAVQTAMNDLFSLKRSATRAERAAAQQAVIDRLSEYKSYAATLNSGGISYVDVATAHGALLEAVNNPDRFEASKLAFKRLKELGDAAKDAKKAFGF